MKHIFKFNESVSNNLLKLDDVEITKIQEIIEDTLIDYDIQYKSGLLKDQSFENGEEFTTSLLVHVSMMTQIRPISNGNPHSTEEIDVSNTSIESLVTKYEKKKNFLQDVKALNYRLKKMGYKINYFSITDEQLNAYLNGFRVNIGFVVENEKILIKNER